MRYFWGEETLGENFSIYTWKFVLGIIGIISGGIFKRKSEESREISRQIAAKFSKGIPERFFGETLTKCL